MARPTKILEYPRTFKKGYKRKSTEDQGKVDQALKQMEKDLEYPSLKASPMVGTKGIWEARASDSVRITFEFSSQEAKPEPILLRKCCTHQQAYRRP